MFFQKVFLIATSITHPRTKSFQTAVWFKQFLTIIHNLWVWFYYRANTNTFKNHYHAFLYCPFCILSSLNTLWMLGVSAGVLKTLQTSHNSNNDGHTCHTIKVTHNTAAGNTTSASLLSKDLFILYNTAKQTNLYASHEHTLKGLMFFLKLTDLTCNYSCVDQSLTFSWERNTVRANTRVCSNTSLRHRSVSLSPVILR